MATQLGSIPATLAARHGHYLVTTEVTTLASGQPLTVTSDDLRGRRDGPTVGIISGLHGDEFSTAEVVLALIEALAIDDLAGALVLVPMANPLTFETATRTAAFDGGDLNRVFPGDPRGTVTQRLAHALAEAVITPCDVLFDLHSEPDAMGIRCFYAPLPEDECARRSVELAKASGTPIVYVTNATAGTAVGFACGRSIPAVVPETGRLLPGADGRMDEAQQEIRNMLRALAVLPGEPIPNDGQVIVDAGAHLRAPAGGFSVPSSDSRSSAGRCRAKRCWAASSRPTRVRRRPRSGRRSSSRGS